MNIQFNATALITPLIDFIVDKIIQAGTSGDTTKQLARAQEILAINNALTLIDQGNVGGAASLANALVTGALTPGEGLALQSLLAIIGNQLALVNTLAGGTLLGGTAEAIVTSILAASSAVCQGYVTKYGTPTPAAAA
jgi:hypothetical protein